MALEVDWAVICQNGHIINLEFSRLPGKNTKFCPECGAGSVFTCQYCKEAIPGRQFDVYQDYTSIININYQVPKFCHNCARPYPWTEQALQAAKILTDEIEELTPDEKKILTESITVLASDTSMTPVAASRFKKLVGKIGKGTSDALYKIVVDVATEAAKKIILGG